MGKRSALLPNNATPFEKTLLEATDCSTEIIPGVTELRGFKFHPLDNICPYLVDEYGLTEIAEYLPDLRTVLMEGIEWQRNRGTPFAIHKSLRWINHDGVIEEFPVKARKWWWFQIHLPFEPRSTDFVPPTTKLVQASKPLRSEFARITAGWDVRAFRLNRHRLNGGAGLNNWSGKRRSKHEPVLSLRVNEREEVRLSAHEEIEVEKQYFVSHTFETDCKIPVSQESSMLATMAAYLVEYQNPATVAFQNAPIENKPFGTPVPLIQIGND